MNHLGVDLVADSISVLGFRVMSWLQRKREERLIRRAGKALAKLGPMQMTPQLRLFGAYMEVRNLLQAGTDPSTVRSELAATTDDDDPAPSAEGYFRAGLRVMFDSDDELAAFDAFARELNEQAIALGHDEESRARQEQQLRLVRDYVAKHQRLGGG